MQDNNNSLSFLPPQFAVKTGARAFVDDIASSNHKRLDKKEYRKMLKHFGLKLPLQENNLFENAAYIFPRHAERIVRHDTPKPDVSQGMIVTHPDLKNQAVVAHELGHAQIASNGGLSGFNQTFLRPAGSILGVLLGAGGYAAGLSGKVSPGAAALISGGGSLLGALPTIVNESQATSRAKDYLDSRAEISPEQRKIEKDDLKKALKTYIYGGALFPAAIWGAIGGSSGLGRNNA